MVPFKQRLLNMTERALIKIFLLLLLPGTLAPMHRTTSVTRELHKKLQSKRDAGGEKEYARPEKNRFFEQRWPLTKKNIEDKTKEINNIIAIQVQHDNENEPIFSEIHTIVEAITTETRSPDYNNITIEGLLDRLNRLETCLAQCKLYVDLTEFDEKYNNNSSKQQNIETAKKMYAAAQEKSKETNQKATTNKLLSQYMNAIKNSKKIFK